MSPDDLSLNDLLERARRVYEELVHLLPECSDLATVEPPPSTYESCRRLCAKFMDLAGEIGWISGETSSAGASLPVVEIRPDLHKFWTPRRRQ